MFRFSIREILLLTVVVALAFGWWLHLRRVQGNVATLQQRLSVLEQTQQAQQAIDQAIRNAMEAQLEELKSEESKVKIRPLHAVYLDPNES